MSSPRRTGSKGLGREVASPGSVGSTGSPTKQSQPVMPHMFVRSGSGIVPAMTRLQTVTQEVQEAIPDSGMQAWVRQGLAKQLDFTTKGLAVEDVRKAFAEVMDASRTTDAIVESGNKYGVAAGFHKMNSELIMHQLMNTEMYSQMKPEDQEKSKNMFSLVFMNDELRNRNPLHPQILDSCIVGNLLNFPKHIFGFPLGSYATDGNESLSLLLFSYREQRPRKDPLIIFVGSSGESNLADVQLCAERLGMEFLVVSGTDLAKCDKDRVVAALTSFESPSLGSTAEWCEANKIDVHLHIRDAEFRNIFKSSSEPVHFDLPSGVRSVTIEEGLLNCGYSLYRDAALRDLHLDVGVEWQTAYMSPNEGGSGQSGPLLMDFCFILCGWEALSWVAHRGLGFRLHGDRSSYRLHPTQVPRNRSSIVDRRGPSSVEAILEWARESTKAHCDTPKSGVSRGDLEADLVCFQREFLGGKKRDLECLVTGGGTRSINLAFESVIKRARAFTPGPIKVITGNPHLAVERAERRFGFQLVRVDVDGALCVEQLKKELQDPAVAAVYTQTLSYTDGTSDPLAEIVQVIEAQNKKRGALPITLINDSCLAFTVLVLNDGENGSNSMRALDLTEGCITPTIVTLDAHKHLGTDKGVSTIVGTTGTLSNLKGHVKVGSQPSKEELARAIANMWLVGKSNYYSQYQDLSAAVERVVQCVDSVGMKIVHGRNRVKGSTVIAVEDPSGACSKMLKKKGHVAGKLFCLARHNPERCQSGWQVSFTPNALRMMQQGKPALDVFIDDLTDISGKIKTSSKLGFSSKLFRENSLPACLISGNIEPWLFALLEHPGYGRNFAQLLIRRYFTGNLDSGIVRSMKRESINELLQAAKIFLGSFIALLALLILKRRSSARRLKGL